MVAPVLRLALVIVLRMALVGLRVSFSIAYLALKCNRLMFMPIAFTTSRLSLTLFANYRTSTSDANGLTTSSTKRLSANAHAR